MKDVFRLLLPLASSWKNIGVLLGLSEDILDQINHDEQGVQNCLRKTVSCWLKQVNPPPRWKDLADAVDNIDPLKAQEIRNQCCDGCTIYEEVKLIVQVWIVK